MLTNQSQVQKRVVFSWALYDWAQSAFNTVIFTFIFATYFTQKIAINHIIGTRDWGYAITIAGIIVVILSPICGAIADHSGRRKTWLALFTFFIIVGSALLWFAKPSPDYLYITLFSLILGTIGIEISQVFYNALLPHIASKEYLGRISGWAWGLGYAGGLVSLCIALFAIVQPNYHWMDNSTAEQVRLCGPFVAIWTFVFSLPLFLKVPDYPATGLSIRLAIPYGLKTLSNTLKTLPKRKNIFLFLIARMIYMDGLNTVFAFGGIYAAGTFNMSLMQVMYFGIVTNISAGLGAALFAWLDDYLGAKKTILLSLLGLIILGTGIVLVKYVSLFWIFSILLSLFFGPVQATSRSMMVRLAPPEQITEMFGLYTLSGRVTAFVGPWLVGTITLLFNSQRVGMGSVLSFFLIGGFLLTFVKESSSA